MLWISGTVPDGLRLDLPPGPAPEAAPLRPLGFTLPGFAPGGRGGIGLSLTGGLSDAASVTLDILQRRLLRCSGTSAGSRTTSRRRASDWTATSSTPG